MHRWPSRKKISKSEERKVKILDLKHFPARNQASKDLERFFSDGRSRGDGGVKGEEGEGEGEKRLCASHQ